MTKAEFLAGTHFHYLNSNSRPYAFVPPNDKNGNHGYVTYFGMNEVNVTKVTETYFDCYTTAIYKICKARIYLKDLYV